MVRHVILQWYIYILVLLKALSTSLETPVQEEKARSYHRSRQSPRRSIRAGEFVVSTLTADQWWDTAATEPVYGAVCGQDGYVYVFGTVGTLDPIWSRHYNTWAYVSRAPCKRNL